MGYYASGDIWEDIAGAVGSVAQYIPVIGTGVAAAAKSIQGGLKVLGTAGGGSRSQGIINLAGNMLGQAPPPLPMSDSDFSQVLNQWTQMASIAPNMGAAFRPDNTMLGSPSNPAFTTAGPHRVRARGGTRRRRFTPPQSEYADLLTGMQPPPSAAGYRPQTDTILPVAQNWFGLAGNPETATRQVEVSPVLDPTERRLLKF